MKKFGLFILGLCTLFFAGNITHANDYEYTNLDITADILIDGTMNVKEDFTANFFVDKHGIIRTIPLNYSVEGQQFHINVSNVNVQGKTFKKSKNNGEIEIKIGDANRTVKGKQNYPISYTTYGLIRNFSGLGYSELYWNLVGYDFDTNINEVLAVINLPKFYTGFTNDDFLITTDGKTTSIGEFQGTVRRQGDKIIITYDKGLPAFHGITLAIKFPSDYFEFNHRQQKKLIGKYNEFFLIRYAKKYLGIKEMIFICIFIIGAIINLPNKIRERNNLKKYPVIVQYSAPKGMDPCEVGLLYNRCAKTSQIIALIYKRAAEGYISFKSGDNTWIVKNKNLYSEDDDENLYVVDDDYKRATWNDLFNKNKKISVPNKRFNQKLSSIEKKLYKHGLKQLWFKNNDEKNIDVRMQTSADSPVWKRFMAGFAILLFIGMCAEVGHLLLRSLAGLILSTIIANFDKVELSEEGYKLLSEIKGYRQFIKTCDEKKFNELLKEDPLFFDKTLPYAVALGLETKFMKKFEPILEDSGLKSNLSDIDSRRAMREINSGIHKESYSSSSTGGSGYSSYSSSSGFDSGSSFSSSSGGGGGFSSGGGGGGGGGRSW